MDLSLDLSLPTAPIKGGGVYNPVIALGVDLLAWWDSAENVTLNGSSVTTWTDKKSGLAPTQSLGGSRPTYSLTSFNGSPGLTLDGVDDCLELASIPAIVPVGSASSWIWAVVSQDEIPANTGSLRIYSQGNGDAGGRSLYRAIPSGVNRAASLSSTGAGAAQSVMTTGDFTGRHLILTKVTASNVQTLLDEVAGPVTAVATNSTAGRVRIGATSGASPSAFWRGLVRDVLITNPLSTEIEQQLSTFLMARRNL